VRRKESRLVAERNSPVIERIIAIKAAHPFWGYRRIWAHLKYIDELPINKKRVLRLLQKRDLLVKPDTKLKAKRAPTRSKPSSGTGLVYQENRRVLCGHAMPESTLAGSTGYGRKEAIS
jgi:hypothetical protein